MSVGMQHITATACPECGCRKVMKFEKSHQHSNGQWNERLTFDCGLMLHHSPNFSRTDVEEQCSKSSSSEAWRKLRAEIAGVMVQAAKAHIGKTDADLSMLARSLRRDLDMYRPELEAKQE